MSASSNDSTESGRKSKSRKRRIPTRSVQERWDIAKKQAEESWLNIFAYNGHTPLERRTVRFYHAMLKEEGLGIPLRDRCDACGAMKGKTQLEPHSEDYGMPYEPARQVITCCSVCHAMIHAREAYPEAWTFYRERVRNGFRGMGVFRKPRKMVLAIYGKNYETAPWRRVEKTPYELFGRNLLDEIHEGQHCPPGHGPVGNTVVGIREPMPESERLRREKLRSGTRKRKASNPDEHEIEAWSGSGDDPGETRIDSPIHFATRKA